MKGGEEEGGQEEMDRALLQDRVVVVAVGSGEKSS